MNSAVVIVAAGRGTRVGAGVPKQWRALNGRPLLAHTIAAFAGHPRIGRIVVVLHPDDIGMHEVPEGVEVTAGGASRADSVRAGLARLGPETDVVLIHDGARPLVSAALVDRVLDALASHDGAAPGVPVTDTLWQGENGLVTGLRDRAGLFAAQTPQGFRLDAIRKAHAAHAGEAGDDVTVALAAGLDVAIVAGDPDNMKITTAGDFARAERILGGTMDLRTGNGFDVHRFGPGDAVVLCGVTVPHERGLQGHSDADVGMHALTDAIYGALAEGDIGRHFPPTEARWKGAASQIFLAHAAERMRARGYRLANADVTLICEEPKIGPHAAEMAARLASILDVEAERISVKATTSERLGFTGRGEGIAALATASLVRP